MNQLEKLRICHYRSRQMKWQQRLHKLRIYRTNLAPEYDFVRDTYDQLELEALSGECTIEQFDRRFDQTSQLHNSCDELIGMILRWAKNDEPKKTGNTFANAGFLRAVDEALEEVLNDKGN